MKTIIAEKPSVGKEIANFLGAKNVNQGYIEGNGYYITWAYGHLVELKSFPELGFSGEWNIENLPFIPQSYDLKLKDNQGVKKQFHIIKKLFSKSSSVICATDAGREGELIFRYLYDFSKSNLPIERLWVNSLTDQALTKAFSNLKPGIEYANLYMAAKARNQADYLVGLNATIGLTAKANISLLSLGRVQTPTLAIVCKRYLEHINFVSTPFYVLKINIEKNGKTFYATSVDSWKDKTQADKVYQMIENTRSILVRNVTQEKKTIHPPLLYDLTSLQQDANIKYGFSASETLEIAQYLYENKFITYPRTGSCYIGDDIYETLPDLINSLFNYENNFNGAAFQLKNKVLNRKSVNADKVTDHHALLITENVPKSISDQKKKLVYELIASRMLEAFSEACIKNVTKIDIVDNTILFNTAGTTILSPGWTSVNNSIDISSKEEEQLLPDININDELSKKTSSLEERFTKAKPLHTEASILKSMETCGKEIEDNDEVKEALKENGIGTPATRASIIEVLFKRSYIVKQSKYIVPTRIGLQVYDLVKDWDISKADLTGEWENKLLKMERGDYSFNEFNQEINSFTKNIIHVLRNQDIKIKRDSIGNCPNCKGDMLENSKAYYCENNQNKNCDFPVLWKEINSVIIPIEIYKELIQKGKTKIVKNFISKDNKKFDAALQLKDGALKYLFEVKDIANCPKCENGKIHENEKSFYCINYKAGCDFTVWKNILNKKIGKTHLLKMLEGKHSGIIKGLKGKKNNEFDAALKFTNEYKVELVFSDKKK